MRERKKDMLKSRKALHIAAVAYERYKQKSQK